MTLGDPNKVKLMVIVAIGAVAFLVIQLLPAPNEGPGRSSQRPDEQPTVAASAWGLGRLARDPFSSALLVKAQDAPVPPAKSARSNSGRAEKPRTELTDSAVSALASMDLEPAPIDGFDSARTKEPVTSNRAKVAGTETVLTVQATLRIDDEVAMITVGKADPRVFRAGASPAAGVLVTSIDSDGVVLKCHGSERRVDVGQAVKI